MSWYLINILLLLNIFSSLWLEFNKIGYTNRLKVKAEEAFHRNNYQLAATYYDSLLTHYLIKDEELRANYAHALFKSGDRRLAEAQYELLKGSDDKKISTNAFQQLGLISVLRGKNEKALNHLRQALKIDPTNEKARFNYELLKKLNRQQLEQEPENASAKKDKNPQGKNKGKKEETVNRLSEHGTQTGEKGEKEEGGRFKQESDAGIQRRGESGNNGQSRELRRDDKGNKRDESFRIRLSEIQLSEEKAKFLLEEMRNEEVQYLQQLRRKQYSKDYDGPDW